VTTISDYALMLVRPGGPCWSDPGPDPGRGDAAEQNLHQLVNKAGLDRLKYAYVLRKHGDTAKAAALVAEADRVARTLAEQQPDTSELRVELAAAFGDASGR
jgi:hypothetical protein